MAYWDEEEAVSIGSKFFQVRYFKKAGKMQISTTSENNGEKTRKQVVLNKYVIDRLKEFMAKEVE